MLVTIIFSFSLSIYFSFRVKLKKFKHNQIVVCKIFSVNMDEAKILLFVKNLFVSVIW